MPSLWASGVRETSVNNRDFAWNLMKNSIRTWKANPKHFPKSLWALWAFGPLGTQVGAENNNRKTRRLHGLPSTFHIQDLATKCGFCLHQDSNIYVVGKRLMESFGLQIPPALWAGLGWFSTPLLFNPLSFNPLGSGSDPTLWGGETRK